MPTAGVSGTAFPKFAHRNKKPPTPRRTATGRASSGTAAKKVVKASLPEKIFKTTKPRVITKRHSVRPARPFGQAGLVTKKLYSQSPYAIALRPLHRGEVMMKPASC
jgi:hypothetical protein